MQNEADMKDVTGKAGKTKLSTKASQNPTRDDEERLSSAPIV